MKTQTELEAMDNKELEIRLYSILEPDFIEVYKANKNNRLLINSLRPFYCLNANDIMPLVVKHKINLIFPDDSECFIAEKVSYHPCHLVGHAVTSNNPYRAAVIVLILLLQEDEK